MNASQAAEIELHCVCGARRVVPAGLRIVSCVKCGQALGPPLPVPGARPAIFLLVVSTHLTQLVSGILLCFALTSVARHLDASSGLFPWLVVPAIGIIAGGKAYRGSVAALFVTAAIDAVVVAMCLAGRDRVIELLRVSGVVRHVTSDAELLARVITVSAGVACLACLAALPQVRRYVAWQDSNLELAFRTRRL